MRTSHLYSPKKVFLFFKCIVLNVIHYIMSLNTIRKNFHYILSNEMHKINQSILLLDSPQVIIFLKLVFSLIRRK